MIIFQNPGMLLLGSKGFLNKKKGLLSVLFSKGRPLIWCAKRFSQVSDFSSKVLFAGSGVTVNALHPGIVGTDIFQNFRILRMWILQPILWFVMYFFFKTTNGGAQTSVYCAVAEELRNTSGQYFKDCEFHKCSELAQNEKVSAELWKHSEEITGLVKRQ